MAGAYRVRDVLRIVLQEVIVAEKEIHRGRGRRQRRSAYVEPQLFAAIMRIEQATSSWTGPRAVVSRMQLAIEKRFLTSLAG